MTADEYDQFMGIAHCVISQQFSWINDYSELRSICSATIPEAVKNFSRKPQVATLNSYLARAFQYAIIDTLRVNPTWQKRLKGMVDEVTEVVIPDSETPQDRFLAAERWKVLQEGIKQLPDAERAVVEHDLESRPIDMSASLMSFYRKRAHERLRRYTKRRLTWISVPTRNSQCEPLTPRRMR